MNKQQATYWIHWQISHRVGEPSFYEIRDDDGLVKEFDTHESAIAWCDNSGESYYDNTEAA